MSSFACQQLAGWDGVEAALAEVRACHADYRSFFSGVFEELDGLGAELQGRQEQLVRTAGQQQASVTAVSDLCAARIETLLDGLAAQQAQIKQLLDDGDRASAQVHDTQDAVAAQVARLAAVAHELAEAKRASGDAPAPQPLDDGAWHATIEALDAQCRQLQTTEQSINDQLGRLDRLASQLVEAHAHEAGMSSRWQLQAEQELAAVIHQRDALAQQQEQVAGQLVRLAGVTAELADTRQELAARCDRLAEQPATPAAAPVDPQAELRLREQLQAMAEQHVALRQEHAAVERELDTVRAHAAELAESLDVEKRAFSHQQAVWTEELQRMRRLLEGLAQRAAAPVVSMPLPTPAQVGATAAAEDPVLDSVMAQFAMLQKDVARRRTAG